jgi:hypothetical protein
MRPTYASKLLASIAAHIQAVHVETPVLETIVDYYDPNTNKRITPGLPQDVVEKRIHSKAWHGMIDYCRAMLPTMSTDLAEERATKFAGDVKTAWIAKFSHHF